MNVIIAGGGTGGHIFPGIAIAEALRQLDPAGKVVFIGAERGLERVMVPKAGFPLELIEVSGLKNLSLKSQLQTLWRLPKAVWIAMKLLRQHKADVVIGVGGYASGPALLAAFLLRIPSAICEQNSVPGFTNRCLAPFVRRIFGSFAYSQQYFSPKRFRLVGNPIRQAFKQIANSKPASPSLNEFHLLVLGGSQGARSLNQCVPEAAVLLKRQGMEVKITHQTGSKEAELVTQTYRNKGIDAEVKSFIENMASAYLAADITLCRAGATTCAEVMFLGIPSIMVPFPAAADDHQTLNAKELQEKGACILLSEKEMTAEHLAALLKELAQDPERREELRKTALSMGRPQAAEAIANSALNRFLS